MIIEKRYEKSCTITAVNRKRNVFSCRLLCSMRINPVPLSRRPRRQERYQYTGNITSVSVVCRFCSAFLPDFFSKSTNHITTMIPQPANTQEQWNVRKLVFTSDITTIYITLGLSQACELKSGSELHFEFFLAHRRRITNLKTCLSGAYRIVWF